MQRKINNEYGVAGLMGNLYAESSLNSVIASGIRKYGMTSEEYTAAVDSGKNDNFVTDGIAYGLAQWCYHTRKRGLLEMARNSKRSVGDLLLQLEYMWDELQRYKTVVNTLYFAKSVREASDCVLLRYEKPANTSESVKAKRAEYGQKYYNQFHNQNSADIKLSKQSAKEIKEELERTLK